MHTWRLAQGRCSISSYLLSFISAHLVVLRNRLPVASKTELTPSPSATKTNTHVVQQRPILRHGNLLFLIIRLYSVAAVGHLAWPNVIESCDVLQMWRCSARCLF